MKFLVLIFVAVALQASVEARPDPFWNDIMAAVGLGGPPKLPEPQQVKEVVSQVITPEVKNAANATLAAQQAAFKALLSTFKGFGFPFAFQRAAANPLATFLGSFITTLKNKEPIVQSTVAVSMLDLVSSIVENMDPTKDPINALIEQSSQVSVDIVRGVTEMIPDLLGMIGQVMFNTQSRSVGSIVGDVSNILGYFVGSLQNVFSSVVTLPGNIIGGAFSDLDAVVKNLTSSISSDKPGLDGGIDILEKLLGSAVFILETANKTVYQTVDPIIHMLSVEFAGALNTANDQIEKTLKRSLKNLAGGSMADCSAPISNSLRMASTGLNDAITNCLHNEVGTIVHPLKAMETALVASQETLTYVNWALNSCLHWDFWNCGWNAGPAIGAVMNLAEPYAHLGFDAAAVYGQIETRLPLCIAQNAVKAFANAGVEATQLVNCMK